MPKTLLSKNQRDRIRAMLEGEAVVNPAEDLGWLLGTVSALLDHADRMDDYADKLEATIANLPEVRNG